jgi:hypothetical protein
MVKGEHADNKAGAVFVFYAIPCVFFRINKAFENNAIVFFVFVIKKKQNVSRLKILHKALIKGAVARPSVVIRI